MAEEFHYGFLNGGGNLADLIKNKDWSQTELGPILSWPEALQIAIGLVIKSRFPMFLTWGKSRRFFYNDAYAVILGSKHPKALGGKFEEVWADIWSDIEPLVLKVDSGESVFLENLRLEMNRFGYHEETFFTFSYSPIHDRSGSVAGLFCSVVETTKQVHAFKKETAAKNELANDRDNLLRLFDANPSPNVLWRGDELIFERVSPAYQALVPGRQLIGLPVHVAMPEPEYEHFFEIIRGVFRTGEPVTMNEQLVWFDIDGTGMKKRYYTLTFFQVKDANGQPYGVYQQAVDNTEQIYARQELERAKHAAEMASQAKSSFLANMSHEIRTPLSAILGYTDLLKDESFSPSEQKNFLEIITRNGKALTGIIGDILDLAKVESGKMEIEMVDFSLKEIIEEVVDLFGELAQSKNLFMRTHFAKGAPSRMISDPTRLRQILINIIGNAVKFTQEGGVTVQVDHLISSDSKPILKITVQDTGIGLSPEQIEKLFHPFVQADNSTTRKFGGTGLGLSLSRRLAQALGGDISVENCQLGRGCSFVIKVLGEPSQATAVSSKVSDAVE